MRHAAEAAMANRRNIRAAVDMTLFMLWVCRPAEEAGKIGGAVGCT